MSRTGARRWNAPRFSCERTTFAGGAGPETSAEGRRANTQRLTRCEHEMREGFRPSTRVHARQRGVRPGSRRGLARRKTARTFTRGGPVRASELLRKHALARLVSSCHPREGADEGKGRVEVSHLSRQYEERRACGQCPCIVVLQKSVERLRAQRSASSVPSGSKARTVCEARERGLSQRQCPARKRERLLLVKGGRFLGARRSTSRERRAIEEGVVGSFAFRCGRVARGSYRGKASRIGEAHAFHEAPAEPVLAAFEPQRGPSLRDPRSRARRRRQRCQRQAFGRARRKKTPPRKRTSGCRSGSRAVKRDSPQPRSHRAAPSFPVPFPRVFGRAGRGAKRRRFARTSTSRKVRYESEPREGAERPPADPRRAALGSGEAWVFELECFGVQKSVGRIAGRDARGRYQAHLGHARPSSKETHAAQ